MMRSLQPALVVIALSLGVVWASSLHTDQLDLSEDAPFKYTRSCAWRGTHMAIMLTRLRKYISYQSFLCEANEKVRA